MPIYVYEHTAPVRDACPLRFERIESVSAAPRVVCPDCGGPVRRVPARFATHEDKLAPNRVKEHGFTTLRRRDDGSYGKD